MRRLSITPAAMALFMGHAAAQSGVTCCATLTVSKRWPSARMGGR